MKFFNLLSKINRKMPLRMIFTVPFMMEIFIIVGLVGFLSYKSGKEAVNNVASQLREEVILKIGVYIERELSNLVLINKLNADGIKRGELNFNIKDKNPQMDYYLWQLIQKFDHVGWIYFGSQEGGEFLGAYRNPDNGELRFSVVNSTTNYLTFDYAINSQGQRTQLMREFTIPYDARKRPWYIKALQASKTGKVDTQIWSPIFPGSEYGYFLNLAQAIYDQNGKLLGVINSAYQLDHIQNFLGKLKISDHGQTFIFDREGLLVASSQKENSLNNNLGRKTKERPSINQSSNPLIQATAKYLQS
ncbi:MAG TPA: cache domain-containing protein, partial [Allocoleopsis sp.]